LKLNITGRITGWLAKKVIVHGLEDLKEALTTVVPHEIDQIIVKIKNGELDMLKKIQEVIPDRKLEKPKKQENY
jgi:hypothetical protein